MTRPHCLFIQSQDLPWRPGYWTGFRPETHTRTLSIEADASAATLLVRTIGGPLDNLFDTDPKPFHWDPPFRPALPPELLGLARPYRRPPLY